MARSTTVALTEGIVMRGMWGVEIRRRSVRHTDFVCPRCGVDRVGDHVEPQRWFAVARVAVIPLATLPTEIVCKTCGYCNDIGVLDVPTTAQLTEFLEMAVRSSIAVVLRAGWTDGEHRAIPHDASRTALSILAAEGHMYDEQRLIDDMTYLDDHDARASLARLAAELTPHGKQGFLHRMASIAGAEGSIDERRRQALIDIGVSLGMSAPHINGVLAVAMIETEAA